MPRKKAPPVSVSETPRRCTIDAGEALEIAAHLAKLADDIRRVVVVGRTERRAPKPELLKSVAADLAITIATIKEALED